MKEREICFKISAKEIYHRLAFRRSLESGLCSSPKRGGVQQVPFLNSGWYSSLLLSLLQNDSPQGRD